MSCLLESVGEFDDPNSMPNLCRLELVKAKGEANTITTESSREQSEDMTVNRQFL